MTGFRRDIFNSTIGDKLHRGPAQWHDIVENSVDNRCTLAVNVER